MTSLAFAMWCGNAVQAGNLLSNPGFETTPIFSAWTAQTTEGWSLNSAASEAYLIRTGANALWMQGLYGNGGALPYYNMGASQTLACAPGSTFSADAWFSQYTVCPIHQGGDNGAGSGLFTSDSNGVEDGWVEVQFQDANKVVLADYKSAILSPIDATLPGSAGVKTINVNNLPTTSGTVPGVGACTWLNWVHCQVTNQFDVSTIGPNIDPATESCTNTLPSGILTAPPGTAYVKYFVGLAQALYESGASYWDDCTLNQLTGASPSVINDLSPSGATFFYTNTSLTFTVNSVSQGGSPLPTNPQSGVKVVVNGVDQSANLQFGGSPTALQVTLPGLAANSLYQVAISVVNSGGLVSTASVNFDTLQPSVVIPVETYDYTNGLFIQNPVPTTSAAPNSYYGTEGTLGVDLNSGLNGGPSLLPNYPFRNSSTPIVAWEVVPDSQLPLYLAVESTNSGVYNVDHNYDAAGNWFNYTKNPWPSGNQEAWLRCAGGNGAGSHALNIVTSGYGTANQTTNRLGEFDMPNQNLYNGPQANDWEKYYWVPLTDAFGNVIPVNIPSGRQTLQLLSADGGINPYVMVLVPFPSSGLPPAIENISPVNGAALAPAAAGLSFTASAGAGGGGATVSSSGISLMLNGASVTSGLSFSGSGPINVTYQHLLPNTIYTAVINVTNSAGAATSRTITFDTMSETNFYVKLIDFNHDGGQWDSANDGLSPLAYVGLNNNVINVDYYHSATGGGNYPYRSPGLAQETTSDVPLPGFVTGGDYDVGNFNSGDWGDYTRNYPAGKYYVYSRLAGYSGTASLALVSSGADSTNQTLEPLGTFYSSVANQGWQNWNWCVLQNNGSPATVTLGGVETLRVTSGGNVNANYFMLVPISALKLSAAQSGNNVVISFPTQVGVSYRVFSRPAVTGGSWSLVATVGGDGTVKSARDPIGTGARFYMVTAP